MSKMLISLSLFSLLTSNVFVFSGTVDTNDLVLPDPSNTVLICDLVWPDPGGETFVSHLV